MADSAVDLARAIARLQAERDVHDLLARLSHLADRGSIDDYLELWTDDGEWAGSSDAARGHAALRERIERYRAAGVQGPGSGTRHVSTTRYVDFASPDEAHAESYFVYFAGLPDDPRPARVGRYADDLVRREGRWLLARRRLVLDDGPAPVPDH